jgi:UDP-glucose 4-epimerase
MTVPPLNNELNNLKGKTVLVTGGTGFIGKHLVKALEPWCKIVVLSRKGTIPGITTINADLVDRDALKNSLASVPIDLVIHGAGNTISPDHKNDLDHFAINATGTKNLLDICRQKDIGRIIYSSSMEVYGQAHNVPVAETHPIIPETYYGMSKYLGEVYCNEYARIYGVHFMALRYSYVYGPGLPEYRGISRFIRNAREGTPLRLFNAGKQATDYIFVNDVVTANILAATTENAIDQTYNIGSGVATSVDTIAKTIREIMKTGCIQYDPESAPVPPQFALDIAKAKKEMNFSPAFSLRDGLKEQINSMIT